MLMNILLAIFSMTVLSFNCYQLFKLINSYKVIDKRKFIISYIIFNVVFFIFFNVSSAILNYAAGFYFSFALLYFVLGLIMKLLNLIPNFNDRFQNRLEFVKIFLTIVLIVWGMKIADNIQVSEYDINLNKNIPNVNLVMLSDIHVGYLNNSKKIEGIVGKINTLEPDIVILGGNFFRGSFNEIKDKETISAALKNIRSKYGVYAILGRDEMAEESAELFEFYETSGVTLLEDSTVEFGSISIIGRKKEYKEERSDITKLLEGLTENNIKILLEQNSNSIKEATDNKIDIFLTSESYINQIFPLNVFYNLISKTGYGYKKIGDSNIVVTSGTSYSKLPIKLGSKSEIVKLKITGNE